MTFVAGNRPQVRESRLFIVLSPITMKCLVATSTAVGLVLENTGQDRAIHVAGVVAVARRLLGIKGIDVLEMRHGGVEPLAVDDQVAVVADLDAFTAQGDQAFDVKLVLAAGSSMPLVSNTMISPRWAGGNYRSSGPRTDGRRR